MRAPTNRLAAFALLSGSLAVVALLAGDVVAAASVGEAQGPGHDVDQKAACLSCHDLKELKAKVKHAPAEACHAAYIAWQLDRPLQFDPVKVSSLGTVGSVAKK